MNNSKDIALTVQYVHELHAKTMAMESQMMMLPSVRKQGTLEMVSPSHKYRPGNLNRPRSSSHGHKYENEIDTKKTLKCSEYTYNPYLDNNKAIEGPIDLSASNTVKIEPESDDNIQTQQIDTKFEDDSEEIKLKLQKNKQKKRKMSVVTDENWIIENVSPDRLPKSVNKREEVLKAAKSLFSKRTRTLYHWMYPDTSKGKLKTIVSSAWDTLSNTEKEFYISQVLGRFGVPAGSLMINPQLGGFQNREVVSSSYAILASANNTITSDIDGNNIVHLTSAMNNCEDPLTKCKKRPHRDSDNNEGTVRSHQQYVAMKTIVSYDNDEFADDPELTTELMQFQKAMGNAE